MWKYTPRILSMKKKCVLKSLLGKVNGLNFCFCCFVLFSVFFLFCLLVYFGLVLVVLFAQVGRRWGALWAKAPYSSRQVWRTTPSELPRCSVRIPHIFEKEKSRLGITKSWFLIEKHNTDIKPCQLLVALKVLRTSFVCLLIDSS